VRWVDGTEVGVEFTGTPEFVVNRFAKDAETTWAEIDYKAPAYHKR
jgi:hypothetical protein